MHKLSISCGDVYMIKTPNQEDSNKFTIRPGICYEKDIQMCSIVPCTTELKQESRYEKTIFISKNSHEAKAMGLVEDSLIMIDRKFEIPENIAGIFVKGDRLGVAPESVLTDIDEAIQETNKN